MTIEQILQELKARTARERARAIAERVEIQDEIDRLELGMLCLRIINDRLN